MIFISHTQADKLYARELATELVVQGADVWFDEWRIKPGDSILGGVSAGLNAASTFVLVWSRMAAKSQWVENEIASYFHRSAASPTLRIVPWVIDDTPIPTMLKDLACIHASQGLTVSEVAGHLLGGRVDSDVARVLHFRHLLSHSSLPMYYADKNERIVDFNDALLELLVIDASDLAGAQIWDMVEATAQRMTGPVRHRFLEEQRTLEKLAQEGLLRHEDAPMFLDNRVRAGQKLEAMAVLIHADRVYSAATGSDLGTVVVMMAQPVPDYRLDSVRESYATTGEITFVGQA